MSMNKNKWRPLVPVVKEEEEAFEFSSQGQSAFDPPSAKIRKNIVKQKKNVVTLNCEDNLDDTYELHTDKEASSGDDMFDAYGKY